MYYCKLKSPTEVMWLNVDDECVTGSEFVLNVDDSRGRNVLLARIRLLGLQELFQTTDAVHQVRRVRDYDDYNFCVLFLCSSLCFGFDLDCLVAGGCRSRAHAGGAHGEQTHRRAEGVHLRAPRGLRKINYL